MHHHGFILPEDLNDMFVYRRQGRDWTAYAALAQSGIDVFFENFMDGTATITSNAGWKWSDVIHDLGIRYSDMAHQDMLFLATTIDDVVTAREKGKIALVSVLESATPVENELDRVDVLYGFGVRSMGITYSQGNMCGTGQAEPYDGGLTRFGRQVVRRMNQLGMTIDTSHCSDKTCLDVIEASKKPTVLSHCGAKTLWDSPRMKSDAVLKACAQAGGVIGVEASPHTAITYNHPRHTIESLMEHFEYIANICGIDHVAFGPDTLFGDHVGIHKIYFRRSPDQKRPNHPEVEWVEGAENPAEVMPNVVRWLVAHGYSDEDIVKVAGANVVRVLKDTWAR
jgi:membrane dipeptidase